MRRDMEAKCLTMAAHSVHQGHVGFVQAERRPPPLTGYANTFKWGSAKWGGMFIINGRAVGLDRFGHQETFNRFFEKQIRS